MTYLYKFEYQHLAQVEKLHLIDDDYKKRVFDLFSHYEELERRYKIGTVTFFGVSGWYEAIDPLFKLAEKIRDKYKNWNIQPKDQNIDHLVFQQVGWQLEKIGFPQDELEKYSVEIHENFVKKMNDSWHCIPFLEALAKQKDERTHKILKKYLAEHFNFYSGTFQAIINYADSTDLPLIEPYMTGIHVEKGNEMGTNSELHQTAKKAYSKLLKAIEKEKKKNNVS